MPICSIKPVLCRKYTDFIYFCSGFYYLFMVYISLRHYKYIDFSIPATLFITHLWYILHFCTVFIRRFITFAQFYLCFCTLLLHLCSVLSTNTPQIHSITHFFSAYLRRTASFFNAIPHICSISTITIPHLYSIIHNHTTYLWYICANNTTYLRCWHCLYYHFEV